MADAAAPPTIRRTSAELAELRTKTFTLPCLLSVFGNESDVVTETR